MHRALIKSLERRAERKILKIIKAMKIPPQIPFLILIWYSSTLSTQLSQNTQRKADKRIGTEIFRTSTFKFQENEISLRAAFSCFPVDIAFPLIGLIGSGETSIHKFLILNSGPTHFTARTLASFLFSSFAIIREMLCFQLIVFNCGPERQKSHFFLLFSCLLSLPLQ